MTTRILASTLLLALACVANAQTIDMRHQLAADVSAERIEADIKTLVGFGTRHTLSET